MVLNYNNCLHLMNDPQTTPKSWTGKKDLRLWLKRRTLLHRFGSKTFTAF